MKVVEVMEIADFFIVTKDNKVVSFNEKKKELFDLDVMEIRLVEGVNQNTTFIHAM